MLAPRSQSRATTSEWPWVADIIKGVLPTYRDTERGIQHYQMKSAYATQERHNSCEATELSRDLTIVHILSMLWQSPLWTHENTDRKNQYGGKYDWVIKYSKARSLSAVVLAIESAHHHLGPDLDVCPLVQKDLDGLDVAIPWSNVECGGPQLT